MKKLRMAGFRYWGNTMAISLALHVLGMTIWVGGMFFAYMFLRPVAASELEPPERLRLWRGVFSRFFPWVWAIIIIVPVTGVGLTHPLGGFAYSPLYVHVMTGLGIVMVFIFLHVFFAPFKRLKRALDADDIPTAAKQLAQIRMLVGLNTIIGLVTIAVATGGKYYLV